jgi:putative FmdB family regulatory protein
MPIYEYKCENCGHEFEEMLHFSERDVPINTPCPFPTCCGKVHLKMSLGSFQLKGDGWYKDGYERKRTDRSGAGGSGGDGKGTPEPQIKTESKAEASE